MKKRNIFNIDKLGSVGSAIGGLVALGTAVVTVFVWIGNRRQNVPDTAKSIETHESQTEPLATHKSKIDLLSLECSQNFKGKAFLRSRTDEATWAEGISTSKQFFVPDFLIGSMVSEDRKEVYDTALITCSTEKSNFTHLTVKFGVSDNDIDARRAAMAPSVNIYVDGQRYYRKDGDIEYETEFLRGVLRESESIAVETDCYSKSGCLDLYFSVFLE